MSYVVLARKYRPKNFAEMVGQEHVVQALGNALTTQRLHHAYLFTGTRGVGKTTVSRILAKSLNCTGPDDQGGITAQPCGVCQACRDIDAGRFVDYTELDAASNRGVDEVQSLLEQAVYKPVQGRFKVFMIDEVHMLTNTAFNAMLKTLEEPPEYLKFVLATTDPQKVPITVLSRCLQFNLRPMAPETVLEHLTRVLAAEQVPAEPLALALLARSAHGSMRDALSLTDQAIAFGGGQLREAAVRQMLGAVDRSHVWTLLEALAQGDGKTVVDTVNLLRLNGFSAVSTLEELVGALQRMAVIQMVPGAAASSDPAEQALQQAAERMPPDETQLLYSLCLHGRAELGLAPDEYAALTMVLLRLLAFKPAANAEARPRAPLAEKKTLKVEAAPLQEPVLPPLVEEVGAAVVPELTAEPFEPVAPSAVTEESPVVIVQVPPAPSPLPSVAPNAGSPALGDFWFDTVQALVKAELVSALVRELALQAELVSAPDCPQPGNSTEPAVWTLCVPSESLAQTSTRDRLQTALTTHGLAVRLQVQTGPVQDTPAKRLAAKAAERQSQAEETILQDPFVQAMMRDFGGKIVPGSLKPV
jgi:DNA polymerase III subunit gamma/tau